MPTRITEEPTIDGVIDENLWQDASSVIGFRTFQPDYGDEMLGDTRVYMAYDDANLYFAFEAFDPEPELIRASVTSRDNITRDDWVAINLDSFGNAQSLYALYINPHGIQGDSRYSAGVEDRGVDLVWYSAGRLTEEGYTVEVRLPLQSIRFEEADVVRMGVIFERRISRSSQWGTMPELDPARAGQWENQMHPLTYPGLEAPRVVEVLPAVTYAIDRADRQGAFATEFEQGDLSLTTKVGLTSDLTFDGTYNPDFSQVEADAGQVDVNLRSAIFYPEKRPFFLEGREYFSLAATGGASPLLAAVYTRQIIDPRTGAKVSGRIGASNTIASVYALDETNPVGADIAYAHVPIVRYRRALSGDSYFGGLYSGRSVDERTNHQGGADARLRLGESLLLGVHGLMSRTDDSSITGGPSVGHSVGLRLSSDTRRLEWSVDVLDLTEDFESDVGFLSRTGVSRATGAATLRLFPSVSNVRRVDVQLTQGQTYDHSGELWENETRLMVAPNLFGSLTVRGWLQRSTEVFRGERFDKNGYEFSASGLISNKGSYGVSFGEETQPIYVANPYQGRRKYWTARFGLKPSSRLDAEIRFNSADFFRESTSEREIDFDFVRLRTTVQPNRYLFFRVITEYDWFREDLLTDFLASFTYIPGTVIHLGYGSLYERSRWDGAQYVSADALHEMRRRFFFKTSYLFRR